MSTEPVELQKADASRPGGEDAILIREITLMDADAAAQLSAELGYPTDTAIIQERIRTLLSSRQRIVYVACTSNTVAGWIEVSISNHLVSGGYGEIGGLIVSSRCRGNGIGRKLLTAGERWVAAQGVHRMVVRSRTTREAAHRFYLREGYSMEKTSAVFSKQVTV
jgi:ribosomal protein S18 acetylase RimI-like enzyme